jgi:hypothetical protein
MFRKYIMDSSEFKNYITSKRPTLSKSSVNTYGSILRSLHRQLQGTDEVDPSFFENSQLIFDHLKEVPPSKRKTVLSALVIITDGDEQKKYRELMMDDIGSHRKEIELQKKTPQQEQNWVTRDEIEKKYKLYEKQAAALFKKDKLTNKEIQQYQQFVILALLGGKHIVPRRAKDYVDMKIRGDIDKDKDNYIDKKALVYNSYKTAKTYGKQTVALPTKLKNILNKWMLINPSDYLLIDSNMQPLGGPDQSANGAVKLNQRIGRIFDKKAGVNILRHSYLTEKFGDTIQRNKQIDSTMRDMGSSKSMLSTYVKEDSD